MKKIAKFNFKSWVKSHYVSVILNMPAVVLFLALLYRPSFKKPLIHYTGYASLGLLALVLSLNPLEALFSKSAWIRKVNRYRRFIGVASLSYALVHVFCYFIKRHYSVAGTLKCFVRAGILPAALALSILILLAVTSNNYSVKKLGFARWKKWHRTVYLAEGCVFLHVFLKGDVLYALLIFGFLVALQVFRMLSSKNKELAN